MLLFFRFFFDKENNKNYKNSQSKENEKMKEKIIACTMSTAEVTSYYRCIYVDLELIY